MIHKTLLSRRVFVIIIAKIGLFFIILLRLFYLQIKENNYFSILSNKNHTNYIPVLPQRGLIYDYFSAPITQNRTVWELIFIKSWLNQPVDSLISNIKSFISLTKADIDNLKKSYQKACMYDPIIIKSNLSVAEIATIESYHSLFPEVLISAKYLRYYPYKETLFHTVGYVTKDTSQTSTPYWVTGKMGIELSLNSILKGKLGYKNYETNAKGKLIRSLNSTQPIDGQNVTITIDANLQAEIYELIEDLSASVVVLDCETGDVLTCASSPGYDPNKFTYGISSKEWKSLTSNPENPFNNRAVAGLYPPASTIKPYIALMALSKGIITPDTKTFCKGYITIGNQKFHCWKHSGHGELNVSEAITQSCDVFFYELSSRLSRYDFIDLAKVLEFNKNLLPILPNSTPGNLPLSNTGRLHLGELAIAAIGQGSWLATPMHLANMANILANNGLVKELRLLKSLDFKEHMIYSKPNKVTNLLPYEAKYLSLVQNAIASVVPTLPDQKWSIAGKTGTAQVVRITQEQRLKGLTQSSKKKYREHGIFMGYMPAESPSYALGIAIEHIGFASSYAIPIARHIANLLYSRHPFIVQEKQRVKSILSHASE